MGLFDRFKKQDCEICGKEVGMFGYKKLKDGEICKDCVKLLSPWFEDRKESTVAQIKEQLAYREKNAQELKNFEVSRAIGECYKMYIEEVDGVPTRFFVYDGLDYQKHNPDIISFRDVIACVVDIEARDEEIMKEDEEGNSVSYNPPRYEHNYNFFVDLDIRNNPYFSHIRFDVNSETVTMESIGTTGNRPANAHISAREQKQYQKYEQMCKEIQEVVERGRQAGAAAQPAAASTPAPKFCPNCGAPADGGKFCQHCGSKLG